MKCHSLIQMILLCFAIVLASCTYTTKLGDKLLPDSEYNTLVVKADSAMQDGEWIKAADFYEKAGQLKPENWDLKLKQAKAFQNAGKLAQAFNAYQIIIDAKVSASDAKDTTLQSAKESQAKLGFKNEKTDTQVEAVKETTAPIPEAKTEAEDVPAQVLVPQQANDGASPSVKESLISNEVIPSPEQVESLVATEDKRILDAVNAWAKAWAAKKLDAYFAHYAEGFAGDMENTKAWQLSRKHKILRSKQIKIGLSEIKINKLENSVEVVFNQSYASGRYQDAGRKTLEMTNAKGRWLIKKELFN
jgi:tetratricopeptide (TPR) repeat protein